MAKGSEGKAGRVGRLFAPAHFLFGGVSKELLQVPAGRGIRSALTVVALLYAGGYLLPPDSFFTGGRLYMHQAETMPLHMYGVAFLLIAIGLILTSARPYTLTGRIAAGLAFLLFAGFTSTFHPTGFTGFFANAVFTWMAWGLLVYKEPVTL